MPNVATQLYHKRPALQAVLEFLGRCESDGQCLRADYRDVHEIDTVKAACASSGIHPVKIIPASSLAQGAAQPCLALDPADWLSLADNAIPQLAYELRLRLPSIGAALKLVPVHWDALEITDDALAAWGAAAGMVVLPKQAVFDYLGSRYPGSAEQRGIYPVMKDAVHAAQYKRHKALGFLVEKDGREHFACHRDDWSREVLSATSLVNHHIALMLKVGLQMLDAGVTSQLQALRTVLPLAGDAPHLAKLQTLLETIEEHVAMVGADQHRFRERLLKNCLDRFAQWRIECRLATANASGIAYDRDPTGDADEWKSPASSASTAIARPVANTFVDAMPTTVNADPVIADDVTIPESVNVEGGAPAGAGISNADPRLKPVIVVHDDRLSVGDNVSFSAESAPGEYAPVGDSVQAGNWTQFNDGIFIDAITAPEELAKPAGYVAESEGFSGLLLQGDAPGSRQADHGDEMSGAAFAFARRDITGERPATPRKSLASALDTPFEIRQDAPTGAQRKRGAEAMAGPEAKRARTGLEWHYWDSVRKRSPSPAANLPNAQARYTGVFPVGAFAPRLADAPPPWLDYQELLNRPSGIASPPTFTVTAMPPAPARPQCPEAAVDKEARRVAWRTSFTSKENQHILDRALRQSIRASATHVTSKSPAPSPAPEHVVFKPVYNGKAPML